MILVDALDSTARRDHPNGASIAAHRTGALFARRDAWAAAVAAPALAILTWPVETLTGAGGVDMSWMGPLHLAAQRHLQFGVDVVFTYGPLGFLQIPEPYYGATSLMALVYAACVVIVISFLAVRAALRVFPLPVALPLAFVGLRAMVALGAGSDQWHGIPEIALAAVFIVSVELVRRGEARVATWQVVGAGFVAGTSLLMKVNVGVVVTLLLLISVGYLGRDRVVRTLLWYGTAAALSIVGAWLALGQAVENLFPFSRLTFDLIVGYSSAMGVAGGAAVEWRYAAAFAAFMIVVLLAHETSRGWSRVQRVALAALVVVMSFATFKAGFVRWHTNVTFGTSVLAAFAILPTGKRRILGPAAIALLAVVLASAGAIDPFRYLNAVASVRAAWNQAGLIASPAHRSAARAATVADTRAMYWLDKTTLRSLRGQSIHIIPMESALAVGYPELRWRPLPVFQDYAVYTSALDQANAQRLRDDSVAPTRILRERPYSIDGRNPWWASPATTIELLCRYREVRTYARWETLARSENRCEPAESIQTLTVPLSEPVPVPTEYVADGLLIARVRMNVSPWATLSSVLLRAPERFAAADTTRYRLVPGTMEEGLLVGVRPEIGYADDFAFGPPVRTLSFEGEINSSETVTVEFVLYRYGLRGATALGPDQAVALERGQ